MEKLQLNLSLGSNPSGAPDQPQLTADWGNINSIDDVLPTIFWASKTGAQRNIVNATTITFTGLTKLINVSFAGDYNLSSVRWRVNSGVIRTGNDQANNITNGDVMIVGALGPALLPETRSTGNIIVNNSTDSYVIDTIPYTVEPGGV